MGKMEEWLTCSSRQIKVRNLRAMNKYLKVICIETLIVTVCMGILYLCKRLTCTCPVDAPRCAFRDDLFMCSIQWIIIEIVLIPMSLVITMIVSFIMSKYKK